MFLKDNRNHITPTSLLFEVSNKTPLKCVSEGINVMRRPRAKPPYLQRQRSFVTQMRIFLELMLNYSVHI